MRQAVRTRRTTRETNRARAQAVAEKYEHAAKAKGNPQRVRKILSEFLRVFRRRVAICHDAGFRRPMAGSTQSGDFSRDLSAV